jgi:hypothetical protein
MKKGYIYLGILVLTILLTHFILPKSVMAYNPSLSMVIPLIVSMLTFGGFVAYTPEISKYFFSVDEEGKENDKKFITLLAVSLFVFIGIFLLNQNKAEAIEFDNNGISAEAIILDGEQTTKVKRRGSSTDSKLKIAFKDNSGKDREESVKIDDKDFDKYALGQAIQIKYLPNDPSLIKVQK